MSFEPKNWKWRLGFIIFIFLLWVVPITMYVRTRPVKDDGFTKYEVSAEAMRRVVDGILANVE